MILKKGFYGLVLACLCLLAYGQDLDNASTAARPNIYLNYGLQYDLLDGFDGIHIYPRWFYSPRLALGLNLELGSYGFSVTPTADYYLTTSKISPFVGLGLPIYSGSSFSTGPQLALKTKLGLSIKRRFELGLEVNSVPNNWLYTTLKASLVGRVFSAKEVKKDNFKLSKVRDLRFHMGIQYNLPQRFFNRNLSRYDGRNSGVGVYLHPKWHRSENLAWGLNLVLAGVQPPTNTDVIRLTAILSVSPTIDYYFTNFRIQPFMGFGTGFYQFFHGTVAWGISPRFGLSFNKKFDFTLQYDGLLLANTSAPSEFNNYYLALKAGVALGVINLETLRKVKQKSVDLTPRHDLRLYFGFQYHMPQRWFLKPAYYSKQDGIALSLYPKWFYDDRFAFGLMLELAGVEGDSVQSYSTIFSFLPSVDYYLTRSLIKPFVGLSAGVYHTNFREQEKSGNLGVKLKVGLSFNRVFELTCEYNRIFSNGKATQNFDHYYVGLKANISIGLAETERAKSKRGK